MSEEPTVTYAPMNKTYFISRDVGKRGDSFSEHYMHRDGKWHLYCGNEGMFADKESAQAFLDKHKDKAKLVTGAAFLAEKELVKVSRQGLESLNSAMLAQVQRDVLIKTVLAWYNDPNDENTAKLESLAEFINEQLVSSSMESGNNTIH